MEDVECITTQTIREMFGQDVELLVDGVTKLSKLNFSSREEQQAESLRKMFLAMAKDIRVVLIKLADRLHNMRTLKYQKPERQVPIARETLDIYAPLAHRLGVYTIKWELEDLALRYIDPDGYYDLVAKVGMRREEREKLIASVTRQLQDSLRKTGIKAEIEGRPKHFYSIYKKMKSQNKTFDQINDLIRHPRAGQHPAGLLLRPRRGTHALAAGAGAVQGLHFRAQGQHVPVFAHHGGQSGPAL